jgi:hypothetical protein
MRKSTAVRNAIADAYDAEVNTGAGTAVLEVYTGSAPGTFGAAPAGTLLGTFALANPAFGASASGTITLAGVPIAEDGLAAGTVGYVRCVNRNGDVVSDSERVGTAGAPHANGNEFTFDTLTVSDGLPLSLTAWTVTMPVGTADGS